LRLTLQVILFWFNAKAINLLLQFSVVGLGFGMNVNSALSTGKWVSFNNGLYLKYFTLGLLGKWLKIDSKTSHLITCGTAICGGSAIAITPVIQSDERLQFL
jgi:uncharacterized membrane protein YadS